MQEGGLEAHKMISAGDKDLAPVFQKLCELVTIDIFSLTEAHGKASVIYNEAECQKLVSDATIEELREYVWLEEVFGAQSRLDNEDWLKKVADPKASWIFEPNKLREKIFEKASIVPRHK